MSRIVSIFVMAKTSRTSGQISHSFNLPCFFSKLFLQAEQFAQERTRQVIDAGEVEQKVPPVRFRRQGVQLLPHLDNRQVVNQLPVFETHDDHLIAPADLKIMIVGHVVSSGGTVPFGSIVQ